MDLGWQRVGGRAVPRAHGQTTVPESQGWVALGLLSSVFEMTFTQSALPARHVSVDTTTTMQSRLHHPSYRARPCIGHPTVSNAAGPATPVCST